MASPLEKFCGSTFWDNELTWNTTNPDFTPCFQKTVLVWVPCGFLWLFSPLETYYLVKSPNRNIPWTGLNITKIVITAALAILALIDMSYNVHRSSALVSSVDYYAPFIQLITFLLVACFVVSGRKRGVQSSGTLFLFWLLLALAGIIPYRSQINKALDDPLLEDDVVLFGTYMVYYPLVLAQFLLAFVADASPEYREHYRDSDENESPEDTSSFVSQVLYWWFNGLAVQGWKRSLVQSDLWTLNYEDRTSCVVPYFEKYWKIECQKKTGSTKSASFSPTKRGEEVKIVPGQTKRQPNITWPLIKAFGPYFLTGAVLKLFQDVLQFVSPQILKFLIEFVSNSSEPLWKGLFYCFLLFASASLQSIVLGCYFHRMFKVGLRIRTSMISAIYKKSLGLSNSAKRTSTVGEIVNLMSVDAQRFMDLMPFLNLIWSAPFQIVLALYFLWDVLGMAVLSGLGVMILMIPLNGVIANLAKKMQMKQMKLKDNRVKMMNEILSGMKVLKLYAWERSFQQKVLAIRDKEVQLLKRIAYLNSVSYFLWTCAPFMVTLITFATFVLMDPANILDASTAFVSLSLFNILRFPMVMLPNLITLLVAVSLMSFATFVLADDANVLDARRAFVALSLFHILRFPLALLPMLISMIVQASVSLTRMNKYLGNEELEPYVDHSKSERDAVVVEGGTFSWLREEDSILRDITLRIPDGALVAVVGQVGTGKSSLLSALLGDMEKLEGHVNIKGSIAYVAQQAWIQNATLKENILFAKAFEEGKYNSVIDACSLKTDFDILPGGDQTEIGEKGINLSGGQKQRVSLARAVYNDADIYFMDDPLSAVDAHVGKHIFEQVIGPQGLLKKKTRVLVTHGISFLPQTDVIVVMKDGSVSEVGSYKTLLEKKGGAFAEFLIQHLQENRPEAGEDLELVEDIIQKVGSPELERQLSQAISDSEANPNFASPERRTSILRSRSLSRQFSHDSMNSARSQRSQSISKSIGGNDTKGDLVNGVKKDIADDPDANKLIHTETAETGEVKLGIYKWYLQSASMIWCMVALIAHLSQQAFSMGSNIWLSHWSNDTPPAENETLDTGLRDLRLGVYGALGLGQGLTVLVGSFALALGTLRASKVLHCDMLFNILRSPMSFFDTTPLGRIVNRFAKDVDTVDTTIPMTIRSWLACVLQVIATMIIISVETPLFMIVIVPVSLLYYFIQRFYVATSRQLKRLESITRSPIYSHFSETLSGVSSIRAYKADRRFIEESNHLVDTNQVCYYPSIVANRWLAIRLEFCGNMLVFFAALFAVLGRETLSPGTVGLSVSYALSVTATLNWMVRMSSELETNIVSVERISEYSTTPTEAPWEMEINKPDKEWPKDGEVVFDQYSTRYREGLDLVVKGISCQIKPGEKIGIVGRTGAGKSSLTLSLFRLIEPAGGTIVIDGVDIAQIGLHDLRSRLTIIPQDPVLFSGTLRLNLDPFDIYTDEEIWTALEHSHLKTFVSSLEAGLMYEATEGGENLSVGQRQLICLARALLRKTKVLVLDEATAAVDLDTDDLIQATIRKEFIACTVLTIAHRLNTIIDTNRVIVLDKGMIVEFDTPTNLLQDKSSIFYAMAKDAGLV